MNVDRRLDDLKERIKFLEDELSFLIVVTIGGLLLLILMVGLLTVIVL